MQGSAIAWAEEGYQIDFPAATVHEGETKLVGLVHRNGQDEIVLARLAEGADQIEVLATLNEPGVAHQPAIATTPSSTVWAFWGQVGADDVMHLMARSADGAKLGELLTLSKSAGSDSFATAGTDSEGRVWVTWQSLRAGQADIFARYLKADGNWSDEIAVATSPDGEWEPRISFDDAGNAWIAWDGSKGNEFNINLSRVSSDGEVATFPIGHSARYEARADITPTADGKGFWIAGERGRVRWGLDARGHGNNTGLNAQKEILFGRFDMASESFTDIPLGPPGKAGNPVNLPAIGVDAEGHPWVCYRYVDRNLWRLAVTRYDAKTNSWCARRRVPDATFGQDRRSDFLSDLTGQLRICYASDLRQNKTAQTSGIYLASLKTEIDLPVKVAPEAPADFSSEPFSASQETPERPADDRHKWKVGEETYGLYWGDLHRHTDVSNCRTGFDGCIAEHFRYAYDIMGTTDHTDVGKIYDPYEWWHNQRMHDALHSPRNFNTLYVYEREQKWPWGHRNIVFAQRGGPIVYINRATYRNSQWQKEFPVRPGVEQIEPKELWGILEKYGKPVAAISHTGGTNMGTDWGVYDEPIDMEVETIVEIFQGARVSYEGIGAPQPLAGLKPKEGYTANTGAETPAPPTPISDFGNFNAGVYQNALAQKHKLGVFASSDHISQHVSYGGVYCKDFTREGIIEGFRARRTVAATDKIYVDFTCNGQPMGTEMTTSEAPTIWFRINGTAPLKRVTIVRNEEDWKVLDDFQGGEFETELQDEAPLDGINRYYLRVEQVDGNMAWVSPVWVTFSS